MKHDCTEKKYKMNNKNITVILLYGENAKVLGLAESDMLCFLSCFVFKKV